MKLYTYYFLLWNKFLLIVLRPWVHAHSHLQKGVGDKKYGSHRHRPCVGSLKVLNNITTLRTYPPELFKKQDYSLQAFLDLRC